MPDYEEIIQQSQANVKSLGEKLKDLDKLHQDIKALKETAEGIPEHFNRTFQDIIRLSEEYMTTLGVATKSYLDGNNTLFTTKLNEASTTLKAFEKETTRLVNTDFTKMFSDLQEVFIVQARESLLYELNRFNDKLEELQIRTEELRKQVERLENIDLEKHFGKLQKTLADIFGAINTVNLTLTNILQTSTSIFQTLGSIRNVIDENHRETKKLLGNFFEVNEKHLFDQDREATKNAELIESQFKSLAAQNQLLKKQIKFNRIIQITGLAIVLFIAIYLLIKR